MINYAYLISRTSIYLSFFLSGLAGLIYEVLWAKYLSLIFGNTTYAHSLVLATFMGGLTIGSILGGKLADSKKIKDKLKLYSWLQIAIALYCAFTPMFFVFSKNIYIFVAKYYLGSNLITILTKFLIGILIILPATIIMGATLPILSRCLINIISLRGNIIARLYFINNLGAILGIFLAGFYLIPTCGLDFSVDIAVAFNLIAGILIISTQQFFFASQDKIETKTKNVETNEKVKPIAKNILYIVLASICLSGFVAMLYEIAWIRLLALVLGSSTYAFSLMLLAFITGITIGSYIISRFMPKDNLLLLCFGACELLIGLSVLITMPYYEFLPDYFLKIASIFFRTPDTFIYYSFVQFFIAVLIMIIPTIFLGMTLPITAKIASYNQESLGQKIGNVFAFNTLGNIIGAIVTGLIIMPSLGLRNTFELGVLMNFFIGMWLLFADKHYLLKRKIMFSVLLITLFFSYKMMNLDWDKRNFLLQVFRKDKPICQLERAAFFKYNKIVYYKDGINSTVAIVKNGSNDITLYNNGKADASAYSQGTGDMSTQILLAQIPLILKPEAKDVLVVGFGSGMTSGSALLHPLNSLDVVEIAKEVIEASKYFSRHNYEPLKDKRCYLYEEDAKTYLQRTDKKYDIIISEPSNPWMSGVGSLFTKEFFNDCKNHLNKDGLMVQWVQGYELDDKTFEIILRTFSRSFPKVTIWYTGINDFILIGSLEDMPVDFNKSLERLKKRAIKYDLSRIKIKDFFTILGLQLSSSENINKVINFNGAINSDFFPVLEYRAPVALFSKKYLNDIVFLLDQRTIAIKDAGLLINKYLANQPINESNLNNLYVFLSNAQKMTNIDTLNSLAKYWYDNYPYDKKGRLAYLDSKVSAIDANIDLLKKFLVTNDKKEYIDRYIYLEYLRFQTIKSFLIPEAVDNFIEAVTPYINDQDLNSVRFYYLLGLASFDSKEYIKAIAFDKKALAILNKNNIKNYENLNDMFFLSRIIWSYLYLKDIPKSLDYAQKALAINDKDPRILDLVKKIKEIADLMIK